MNVGLFRSFRGGESKLGLALVAPILIIMGLLVLFPLVITVIDSFYRVEPMKPGTPFVGFKNYTSLLNSRAVQMAWGNTAVYVIVAVSVQTILGLCAALVLNKLTRGRRWLLAIIILPWCLPPVVNAIIWGWIYNPSFGLLNAILYKIGMVDGYQVWFNDRFTGLVLISIVHAWRMMPLTAIILLAARQSIPSTFYEAARLDGASPWRQFREVTLPLISGGLAIALSQSTVFALNLFDEAWILNGNALDTRPVLVMVYQLAFSNLKFSMGMALSLLVMIASLVMAAFYVLRVYKETRFD
jgi:multiple sugar transport system permease protein